jgi:hypothetical protein
LDAGTIQRFAAGESTDEPAHAAVDLVQMRKLSRRLQAVNGPSVMKGIACSMHAPVLRRLSPDCPLDVISTRDLATTCSCELRSLFGYSSHVRPASMASSSSR